MMGNYSLVTPSIIKRYLESGQAVVTLKSEKSGAHYTFKFTKKPAKDAPDFSVYFISQLIGSNEYMYVAFINQFGEFKYKGPGTKVTDTLKYLWRNITEHNRLPPQMEVMHEGRCGACGRPLTTPESIISGIGPICAGKE